MNTVTAMSEAISKLKPFPEYRQDLIAKFQALEAGVVYELEDMGTTMSGFKDGYLGQETLHIHPILPIGIVGNVTNGFSVAALMPPTASTPWVKLFPHTDLESTFIKLKILADNCIALAREEEPKETATGSIKAMAEHTHPGVDSELKGTQAVSGEEAKATLGGADVCGDTTCLGCMIKEAAGRVGEAIVVDVSDLPTVLIDDLKAAMLGKGRTNNTGDDQGESKVNTDPSDKASTTADTKLDAAKQQISDAIELAAERLMDDLFGAKPKANKGPYKDNKPEGTDIFKNADIVAGVVGGVVKAFKEASKK